MIGALRHQVQLLVPARTPDDGGGASVAWNAGAEIFASVEYLPSARAPIGGGGGARETRIRRIAATIRRRSGVVTGDRLRFQSADYEITSIEGDIERDARLTLVGEEIIGAGVEETAP